MTRRGRPSRRSAQRVAEAEVIASRARSNALHVPQEPPKPPDQPRDDRGRWVPAEALAEAEAEIDWLRDTIIDLERQLRLG